MRLPDAEPPFFFRRLWTGPKPLDEITFFRKQGKELVIVTGVPGVDFPEEEVADLDFQEWDGPPLLIYGRAVAIPHDQEDTATIARYKERGICFAECYSTDCPDGELGTHPYRYVEEISEREFRLAREVDWQ